jgi:uncharacterized lipoprotein YehR (DUF1307 family)
MKAVNSEVYPKVVISGKVEESTKNFKIVLFGYVDLQITDYNTIVIEDSDIEDEEFYFRGDKVDRQPLLTRLKQEGYVDLVKELEEISKADIVILQKENQDRLRQIFNVEEIFFFTDFTVEEKVIINMHRVLQKDFEKELYSRRKDVCNSQYGFTFVGENLSEELISLKEYTARFELLLKANKYKILKLLNVKQ